MKCRWRIDDGVVVMIADPRITMAGIAAVFTWPLVDRQQIREAMRAGNDTCDIAVAFGVSDAEVWNCLCEGEKADDGG